MSPWLFNVNNSWFTSNLPPFALSSSNLFPTTLRFTSRTTPYKELLSTSGSRFEVNQLLFADVTAVLADSEEMCRLVSEFGKVDERRKLRVNVGKSKVMKL